MVHVEVWLYGPLSQYGGSNAGESYACLNLELPDGTTMRDLLTRLGMPVEEKGITFVNGQLTDMPGLAADLDLQFSDRDRVGFFHERSMWPFQYRFGADTRKELQRAMSKSEGGALRHSTGPSAPGSASPLGSDRGDPGAERR